MTSNRVLAFWLTSLAVLASADPLARIKRDTDQIVQEPLDSESNDFGNPVYRNPGPMFGFDFPDSNPTLNRLGPNDDSSPGKSAKSELAKRQALSLPALSIGISGGYGSLTTTQTVSSSLFSSIPTSSLSFPSSNTPISSSSATPTVVSATTSSPIIDTTTTSSAPSQPTSTTSSETPVSSSNPGQPTGTGGGGGGGIGEAPTSSGSSGDNGSPPSAPAPAPTSSATANVIVPLPQTSVDDQGDTQVSQGVSTAPVTANAPVAMTTTDDQGNQQVMTSSVPALVFPTTDDQGNTMMTTSPLPTEGPVVSSSPSTSQSGNVVVTTDQFGNTVTLSGATDGAVITTTDAAGRTITTTYHPGGSAVRSLVVETSTLPNGDRATLTSVAVVVPSIAETSNAQQAAGPSNTGSAPGLVTGNAGVASRRVGKEAVALVAGAAGVAWLL